MHPIIFLPLFISIIITFSACNAAKGSIVILEDGHGTGFTMDMKEFNSENKCELSLSRGDEVQVEFEHEDGRIIFSVNGKNGSEPYSGNCEESVKFTITVSESDDYVFKVKGEGATGKITVKNLAG